jgi:hypothetical protein
MTGLSEQPGEGNPAVLRTPRLGVGSGHPLQSLAPIGNRLETTALTTIKMEKNHGC